MEEAWGRAEEAWRCGRPSEATAMLQPLQQVCLGSHNFQSSEDANVALSYAWNTFLCDVQVGSGCGSSFVPFSVFVMLNLLIRPRFTFISHITCSYSYVTRQSSLPSRKERRQKRFIEWVHLFKVSR